MDRILSDSVPMSWGPWHVCQVLGKKTAKGRGRPAAVGSSTPKRWKVVCGVTAAH